MKKIIFTLSFITILLGAAFSQSLEIYFENELLEPDQEITVAGEATSTLILLDAIDVKNISSNGLHVKCARENIDTLTGTSNAFCWGGLCYSSTTDTSGLSVIIDPDGIYDEFNGDYYPDGNEGETIVKYTFFDENNLSDKVSVIVRFTTLTGIDDPTDYKLSAAYPNPANSFVKFDYDLSEISNNSKVVIYNLLGSAVKEVRIDNSFGSLKINTSDFNEGIYFYSLVVNNEPTKTQKLLIKH